MRKHGKSLYLNDLFEKSLVLTDDGTDSIIVEKTRRLVAGTNSI